MDHWEPDREDRENDIDKLEPRQKRFLRTLLAHPSYGAHVNSIAWLYVNYDPDTELPPDEVFLGDDSPAAQLVDVWPNDVHWKVFASMTRVRTLEYHSWGYEEFADVPPHLFQTASSITLSGLFSYSFLRGLLSNPSNIACLKMVNIQSMGQSREKRFVLSPHSPGLESTDPQGNPILRYPGPVVDYLHPLSRFTKLTVLDLSILGVEDCTMSRILPSREARRYREIAQLITATSSILQQLSFTQVPENPGPTQEGHDNQSPPRQQTGRPMDGLFLRHILPVLLSEFFPKIIRIKICGVGGRPYSHVLRSLYCSGNRLVFQNAEEDLRNRFNKGVQLVWEEEINESLSLFSECNTFHPQSTEPSAEVWDMSHTK